MKTKRMWLFATSLLFLNCLVVAVAQTTPPPKPKSAPNACEQFKGIVVEPDTTIEHKMRSTKPDETIDYKGIVVNPCEKKTLVRAKPLPAFPRLNPTGLLPAPENKSPSANSPVKPIAGLVNSSEMLRKARLAKEKGQ